MGFKTSSSASTRSLKEKDMTKVRKLRVYDEGKALLDELATRPDRQVYLATDGNFYVTYGSEVRPSKELVYNLVKYGYLKDAFPEPCDCFVLRVKLD